MYGRWKYYKLDKRNCKRFKMKFSLQIDEIKKKFSHQILVNEKLSKYSWFNLGGPAKILFKPKNLSELSIFLKNINGMDNIKVLGAGSNTLIRDGGFNGIIIKLGKSFSHISLFDKNRVAINLSDPYWHWNFH